MKPVVTEAAGRGSGSRSVPVAPGVAVPPSPAGHRAVTNEARAVELLNRAEADINQAIEALNQQMNAAFVKLTELVGACAPRGHVVVRTAPMDRATATFHRLVAEVVEDQHAEVLPPLIALRQEFAQRSAGQGAQETADDGEDFHARGLQTLDHVLALMGVQHFQPRPGEPFDALIHLAVGETRREDLPDGTVAEILQPGFRTGRGKVVSPARILVNRR